MKKIANEKDLYFALYCIEKTGEALHMAAPDALDLQKYYNILNDFIIPNADILQAESGEDIIEDILQTLKERGYAHDCK